MAKLGASFDDGLLLHDSKPTGLVNFLGSNIAGSFFLMQ